MPHWIFPQIVCNVDLKLLTVYLTKFVSDGKKKKNKEHQPGFLTGSKNCNMTLTLQTKERHGYSVSFSPYFGNKLAVSTSQHFGIAGKYVEIFLLEHFSPPPHASDFVIVRIVVL